MPFYADLHVHSKYSRATSREGDLEHLALAAAGKGLAVVATGDFTHPAWSAELKEKLLPAEPGLFRLRPEIGSRLEKHLPASCRRLPAFILSVEISTIYKKNEKTRKVHHLILCPDLESADRLRKALKKIGNLESDGRPILGLDSRDLLEIALGSGPGAYLIPAHVWTPWFSVLGSKSGFDSIAECYADLAPNVFALETGLSSDPPMNWRLAALDRYRLVSNSDAHSPAKLGREACVFDTDLDYFAMKKALESGPGYGGTLEFFPEEGKYHLDGHRSCGVRLTPEETRQNRGRCPQCGKPVTVGVMSRVQELADEPEGRRPEGAAGFRSLVPLAEIIAEILECGAGTKGVAKTQTGLISRLGPELFILAEAPLADIGRVGSPVLAEAIKRMREGRVIRSAGYDGEYGVIRLFADQELKPGASAGLLFEITEEEKIVASPAVHRSKGDQNCLMEEPEGKKDIAPRRALPLTSSSGLDPDQMAAAEIVSGPLLIIAGPGAGKTRTLTHRIANLIRNHGVPPEQCLALTFTRKAAQEMRERLHSLLPENGDQVPVMTFHALGFLIISEHSRRLDLPRRFRVAAPTERLALMRELGLKAKAAEKMLREFSELKRRRLEPGPGNEFYSRFRDYQEKLRERGRIDLDDLLGLPLHLLETEPQLAAYYQNRWPYFSADEFQDIDEPQYALLKLLCPPAANLCVIGDPDQAIYGFRGADVRFFLRFQEDFPAARVARLSRNYRSNRSIVEASGQVIAESELALERKVEALIEDPARIAVFEAASDKAEAEFVVQSLEQMIGGHSFFSIDSGRAESTVTSDFNFSDFAVLYRTEAQAEALAEALQRSGIPFQRRSHRRVLEHPGVAVIVEKLRDLDPELPLSEKLRRAAATAEALARDERDSALELLLSLAEKFRDENHFLSELALAAEADDLDPRADRVALLTLHAAKGLEFRVVFIAGCEDGVLPLKFGRSTQLTTGGAKKTELEEERRLFYVGMTRAKDRLVLIHARKRRWRGKLRAFPVSPFLRDIEEKLLARSQAQTKKKAGKKAAQQMDLF